VIGWKSITVETRTHIAYTSEPIWRREEYLSRLYRGRSEVQPRELLGVKIKPIVRVPMGRG